MRTTRAAPRHPGRILEEDFLSRLPEETTQGEVAERLAMSRPRLNDLIHGRRSVTLDTALRLARCFGTEPDFWLQAQMRWDLFQAGRSRAQMREIERIEPWPLRAAEPAEEEPTVVRERPLMFRPQVAGPGAEGAVTYYEEFLRRRGMLEEARRFARIQAQLDVLEPDRPDARRRLRQPVRILSPAIALPPLHGRGPTRELPTKAAGSIL